MKTVENTYFLTFSWAQKLYPNKVTFGDFSYNLPKSSWVFNALYPFFRGEMKRWGVLEWSEKFDCEDFAQTFRVLAKACHHKSSGSAQGIAVGEIDYQRDDGVNHCINTLFTEKGLIFFEPLTGKSLILSDEEIASIRRFRI